MTKIVESASADLTFCPAGKTIVDEKISLNVSRRLLRPAWMAGVLTSRPNFSPLRPYEVVIAAQRLKVSFQSLPPSRVAEYPAKGIRRALSDRQIQPFDERGG